MKFIFFILLLSCSLIQKKNEVNSKTIVGSTVFEHVDNSGKYISKREIKLENKKLISRVRLMSQHGGKDLETQVSVSLIGAVKTKNGKKVRSLIPHVSQFKVWFEKKEYFSQISINRKSQKLEVKTKSPEKKWNYNKIFDIPKGNFFCFFSQIPECLKLQNLLFLSARKKVDFFVIWDNFPYHRELYEGLEEGPVTMATVELSRNHKKELVYNVDLGNQMIFYHYDKNLIFRKMFWISQGLRVVNSSKE